LNTLKKVEKLLDGRRVDYLFIDGDHTYEGVKMDYEMYSRLVRPGGIIAFHDIVEHPRHLNVGVPRFWRELKRHLPPDRYVEIVKDWKQGWAGIGLIYKE
jgi:predicted O-methyltransferase YrrM